MTTANQRLKERWSMCLVGSMLCAVAFHWALAGLLPPWTFTVREPRTPNAMFVQLIPISAPREPVDAEPVIHEQIASLPEVQPEPEELSEPPLPELPPVISLVRTQPAVSDLEPTPVSIKTPADRRDLSEMIPPIAWPEITNPEQMVGYIRERYNPIYAADGATGIVVLALWVDERGTVARVRLSESSGFASLDEIAISTFESVVTFRPARDGPRAIPVQFNLSVPFLLEW